MFSFYIDLYAECFLKQKTIYIYKELRFIWFSSTYIFVIFITLFRKLKQTVSVYRDKHLVTTPNTPGTFRQNSHKTPNLQKVVSVFYSAGLYFHIYIYVNSKEKYILTVNEIDISVLILTDTSLKLSIKQTFPNFYRREILVIC